MQPKTRCFSSPLDGDTTKRCFFFFLTAHAPEEAVKFKLNRGCGVWKRLHDIVHNKLLSKGPIIMESTETLNFE